MVLLGYVKPAHVSQELIHENTKPRVFVTSEVVTGRSHSGVKRCNKASVEGM
jgi:hypothetical protein